MGLYFFEVLADLFDWVPHILLVVGQGIFFHLFIDTHLTLLVLRKTLRSIFYFHFIFLFFRVSFDVGHELSKSEGIYICPRRKC